MDPLIISVAVTGGEHGREATPHLPVTPAEIAESAYEAHVAGAAVAHLHVRDDDERPVHDLARYAYVANRLRERCDMVVNLTTDPGGETTDEEQPIAARRQVGQRLDGHAVELDRRPVRAEAVLLHGAGPCPAAPWPSTGRPCRPIPSDESIRSSPKARTATCWRDRQIERPWAGRRWRQL